MKHQAGKGDTYRPVDQKRYSAGYDLAFGKDSSVIQSWVLCEKHKRGMNSRNPCPDCEQEREQQHVPR